MPNPVKYNTESEANALTIGNMHVGAGDVPKGPTSSTGFYNGINPPNGGYTIYLNKSTQGPSIYTPSNDAELISITNKIAGASYTTINECFNYFAGQNDKFVLHNPINSIVTDGLTLYLNAAPLPSYPRSGGTCYDLSTDSNNADFYNGSTFNSTLETMEFDGVDDYILTDNNATNTGDQSIETTIKFDSLEGFLQGLVSNHNYAQTANFGINQVRSNKIGISIGYTNGTREYQDKYSTTAVVTGRFYHIVMTFNLSANQCKLYIDGVLDSTFNLSKTVKFINRPLVLGRWDYNYGNYYFDGEISQAKYYSKTLSAEEVSLNYYQSQIITDGLVFAIDASNLVSYENGDTTTHSLTGSVDGTLTNGVSFNGNSDGIWEFDGVDDYIAINNLGLSSHTIEGWFNSDDGSQGGAGYATICSIFGNYDGGSSKYTYIGLIPNLTFRIDDGATSHAGIATVSYTANTWYHVALTYDATSGVAKAYVNGDEVGSRNSTTNITFNSIPHNIAKTQPNVHFDGEVALHRTYNRALTEGEIENNYKANINKFN